MCICIVHLRAYVARGKGVGGGRWWKQVGESFLWHFSIVSHYLPSDRTQRAYVLRHVLFKVVCIHNSIYFEGHFVFMTPPANFHQLVNMTSIPLSSPNCLVCCFIKWVTWNGKNVEVLTCNNQQQIIDVFPYTVSLNAFVHWLGVSSPEACGATTTTKCGTVSFLTNFCYCISLCKLHFTILSILNFVAGITFDKCRRQSSNTGLDWEMWTHRAG